MSGHQRTGRNHRPSGSAVARTRPLADRETYRRRRQDLADAVAIRIDRGRELDGLAGQIRAGMEQLRQCTTPAQRAEVEAWLRPLAEQRRMLSSAGIW